MNEEQLIEFVNWLPTAIPEFKDATPDQIVQALNQMSESDEGQQMLSQLINTFQQAKQSADSQMFKKGGKLAAFVSKYGKGGEMCCKKKAILQGGMVNKVAEKMQDGGNFYRKWSPGDIKKLQMFLSREDMLGNDAYKGEFDGIANSEFIKAVRAYQKRHNFKEDGMWGYNTNQVHRVLDSDILAKGSYKPTHRTEQGDLIARPTSFSYNKLSDFSNSDAQKIINYYSINPELLFSDNPEHAKWRQIFHNSGKDGADFINQMFGSLTPEERKKIDAKKLTDIYKTDQLVSTINAGRDKTAEKLAPVLASPFVLGPLASTTLGGGLVTAIGGLAGSTIGAKAGERGGDVVGKVVGKRRKDKPYTDPISEEYGVASSVIDPERRISEAAKRGREIGGLSGGFAGGALGGLGTSWTQANTYNVMGLGRAFGGYKGKPTPVTINTSPYGSVTPPNIPGISKWTLFKKGLDAIGSRVYTGNTRAGGGYGTSFRYKGKRYNPGNFASPEVISAMNQYYNNPNSPIRMNFGGPWNNGTGVKIGVGYGVNPLSAINVGISPTGTVLVTDDLTDKE